MTADELRKYFIETYGISIAWPKTFEVDHETYANCCQEIFNNFDFKDWSNMTGIKDVMFYTIALGPNRGLMFKNVELILKK